VYFKCTHTLVAGALLTRQDASASIFICGVLRIFTGCGASSRAHAEWVGLMRRRATTEWTLVMRCVAFAATHISLYIYNIIYRSGEERVCSLTLRCVSCKSNFNWIFPARAKDAVITLCWYAAGWHVHCLSSTAHIGLMHSLLRAFSKYSGKSVCKRDLVNALWDNWSSSKLSS
jgi:hypothetical protein